MVMTRKKGRGDEITDGKNMEGEGKRGDKRIEERCRREEGNKG